MTTYPMGTTAMFNEIAIDPNLINSIETTGKDGSVSSKPGVNRQECVRKMVDTLHPIYYYGHIWVYDATVFKYVPNNGHIESYIMRTLCSLGMCVNQRGIIEEALAAAMLDNYGTRFPFNSATDLINCRNGAVRLTIDGPKLEPHLYEHRFNYVIDTDFNPAYLNNTPELDKVLNEWGPRKWVLDAGSVAIAQLLMKDTFKTAFMAEGPGDAGKTTMIDLFKKTLGDNAHSAVDLTTLTTNDFALSNVEGMLMNLADETPAFTISSTERFKRITGSVYQPINQKYCEQRNGVVTAVYLFACNDLPDTGKIADPYFYNRWNIEEFKNKFVRSAVKKKEILSDRNCQQLLCRCIQGAQDILINGWICPQTPDEVEEHWKSRTINADRFLWECYTAADSSCTISLADIVAQYLVWCKAQEGHVSPVSDRALSVRISRLEYGKRTYNNRVVFSGIERKFEPVKKDPKVLP